jgi:hypothetical protein
MTVVQLMEILCTADPLAKAAFLPWGADEDEVEEVDAVHVPRMKWTCESYRRKGQEYKALQREGPCAGLPPGSENAVVGTCVRRHSLNRRGFFELTSIHLRRLARRWLSVHFCCKTYSARSPAEVGTRLCESLIVLKSNCDIESKMDSALHAASSERCRTKVKIYDGEYLSHDAGLPLVCAGIVEVDSTFSVWSRALIALRPEALRPAGPYLRTRTATVLITRSYVEERKYFREARMDLILVKGEAHTSVLVHKFPRLDALAVRVSRPADIVTVVRAVLRSF